MAPSLVHLPNGQTLTVNPVFGGLAFKSNELSTHRSAFPPGWNIILNQESEERDADETENIFVPPRKHHIHRYKRPSLHNDHLFISSISNPSSHEFRPASSPTRQIAMMLWATLWWYFHQPEPDATLTTPNSKSTVQEGRPRGEWRVNINREGIFKGKNVLAKLERMGLIATEDTSVGTSVDEKSSLGWSNLFVSRRSFWQMDPRIYLFTLSPVANSPFPAGSPFQSRPASPTRKDGTDSPRGELAHHDSFQRQSIVQAQTTPHSAGPFQSSSHLPTYYPPHPLQYTFTNGIRHPIRPKPFRQGETFYIRYIPSLGQYLSFRVASLSPKAPARHGPWSGSTAGLPTVPTGQRGSLSDPIVATLGSLEIFPTDVELLHKWMNDPRVAHSWGEDGPESHQEEFLRNNLSYKHSFPVIGCFDGKPFGYFEIYWVKEDNLGKHVAGDVGDWDRGIHCLVGEQEFRGAHRVNVWLSALIHYCWLADMRSQCVYMEPRIDNIKMENYCKQAGFFKEREVAFPHKQSNLMKIRRDAWEKPGI